MHTVKLNLGSGSTPLAGFVNVDKHPATPGLDVLCDLDRYPWPWEDDSVEEIVMDNCLEHLEDRNRAMKEIHRILKPGGKVFITVPHFTWHFAFHDPTHRHFFGYRTFSYYCKSRDTGYFDFGFSRCNVRLRFGKRLSFWNYILEPFANRFPDAYEQSPLRIFPALVVEATLIK